MKARHGKRLGTVVRSIVPLTFRGVTLVCLATALLVVGVMRADLAALFWGASFLVFAGYALLSGHIYRLALVRRRSEEPDFLSIVLPGHALTVGDRAEAALTFHLPRSLPPGFTLHVLAPLEWQGKRRLEVRIPVTTRKRAARVTFTAARRGVFECTKALLVAKDVLGLTAHGFPVALRESVTVVPRLAPALDVTRTIEHTEESTTVSPRQRRSETLLEVRKYYPGDDPRRLNWKVFAHTDELFLRIGEEVPSPEARLLFVLDTSLNPLIPARLSADYIDSLVEACGSAMTGLLSHGADLLLSMPGSRECHSFSRESIAALQRALANAWWTESPWKPVIPSASPHVIVFASPGSPGLSSIMGTVRARDWTASIFIKPLIIPERRVENNLKGVFFLSPDGVDATKGGRLRRKESRLLQDALGRDLAAYPQRVKEVRNVAEI